MKLAEVAFIIPVWRISQQPIFQRCCSDPNNESDPSSEYSLLGLTHVMNHCLGQKFIIWVKINCLDMSLKPGTGIPRPRTVHESLYILLEMQHTQMGFHAFKMADKIARKEGHRQVFVEYVNEIADNSRTASFRFYEDFTEIGHNTVP